MNNFYYLNKILNNKLIINNIKILIKINNFFKTFIKCQKKSFIH